MKQRKESLELQMQMQETGNRKQEIVDFEDSQINRVVLAREGMLCFELTLQVQNDQGEVPLKLRELSTKRRGFKARGPFSKFSWVDFDKGPRTLRVFDMEIRQ
ncbi:hypothetical protein EAF00_002448 [Botryotinia globosa]|nr:hypothetical protein EAF00_002448 [Botryotinia globosa]